MLNRHFSYAYGMVSRYFHEVDSCWETVCRYLMRVALHLAAVTDLSLKVVKGQLGME